MNELPGVSFEKVLFCVVVGQMKGVFSKAGILGSFPFRLFVMLMPFDACFAWHASVNQHKFMQARL